MSHGFHRRMWLALNIYLKLSVVWFYHLWKQIVKIIWTSMALIIDCINLSCGFSVSAEWSHDTHETWQCVWCECGDKHNRLLTLLSITIIWYMVTLLTQAPSCLARICAGTLKTGTQIEIPRRRFYVLKKALMDQMLQSYFLISL